MSPLSRDFTLEKWSGRPDSNRRPPAPKSEVPRCPAIGCETTIGLKFLIQNDLTHVIAMRSHLPHRPAEPAGNPQRSTFLPVTSP